MGAKASRQKLSAEKSFVIRCKKIELIDRKIQLLLRQSEMARKKGLGSEDYSLQVKLTILYSVREQCVQEATANADRVLGLKDSFLDVNDNDVVYSNPYAAL